jgi:hypothetical protein
MGYTHTGSTGFVDWPFQPELSAQLGLGDGIQAGVDWDFVSGLGVDGLYRLGSGSSADSGYQRRTGCWFGPPELALGARAGWYVNDNGVGHEGVWDFSPRFLLSNDRSGGIPYAVNLGIDCYGYRALGSGPSGATLAAVVNIGVPFSFVRPIRLGDRLGLKLRVQPEAAVSVPFMSSPSGVKGSFSEIEGLSLEVDPIDYRTGAEDVHQRKIPGLPSTPGKH